MRIIVSYFFSNDSIPYGSAVVEALQSLGHEVSCFDSTVEHALYRTVVKRADRFLATFGADRGWFEAKTPWERGRFKRQRLESLISQVKPELVLVIQSNFFFTQDFAEEMKRRHGVKCFAGWRVDGPDAVHDIDQDADIYDLYYCIHRHGYKNPRVRHLPMVAVDGKRYFQNHDFSPNRFRHDTVFVGGWNSRRQNFAPKLKQAGVEIYGKWGKANYRDRELRSLIKAKGIWGEALVELYNTSKICLNILGWDPRLDPCCNLRTFDIPSCGAMLLSEYSGELEEYFRLDKEAVSFSSGEEMCDKIAFYLRHDDSREEIARRGWEKSRGLPTVADRVAVILRDYENLTRQ